jgi:putative ABC transport system permease protein
MVAAAAAGLGTFRAVAAARSPAAGRSHAPASAGAAFRQAGSIARGRRWLAQTTRIILRNLSRHQTQERHDRRRHRPVGSLLLLGSYQFSAVSHMIDVQYRKVLKMDTHVTFIEPTSRRVLAELDALPGVMLCRGLSQRAGAPEPRASSASETVFSACRRIRSCGR